MSDKDLRHAHPTWVGLPNGFPAHIPREPCYPIPALGKFFYSLLRRDDELGSDDALGRMMRWGGMMR